MKINNFKIFWLSFSVALLYFSFLNFILEKTDNYVSSNRVYFYASPIEKNERIIEMEARAVISLRVDKNGEKSVIYSKNEDERLPIASITKLMTALIVYDFKETYNPYMPLMISNRAAYQRGVSVLFEGEFLSIKELLKISLIESSNDAAYALAEVAGERTFIEIMNLYAKRIGLENTSFVNSTGLNQGEDNLSTAKEVALLIHFINENYPEIIEITGKEKETIRRTDGSFRHTSINTNILLSEYDNIIGGKTGWTSSAKECLAIIISLDDGYIINVILGSDNRFEEMRKLISIY